MGHNAKLDQKAAKNPENPFSTADNCSTFFPVVWAMSFWQTPFAAKRIEFSAIFAIKEGAVPAYKPLAKPSLAHVSLKIIYGGISDFERLN